MMEVERLENRSRRPRRPPPPPHPSPQSPPVPSDAVLSSMPATQTESSNATLQDIAPGPSSEGKEMADTSGGYNRDRNEGDEDRTAKGGSGVQDFSNEGAKVYSGRSRSCLADPTQPVPRIRGLRRRYY